MGSKRILSFNIKLILSSAKCFNVKPPLRRRLAPAPGFVVRANGPEAQSRNSIRVTSLLDQNTQRAVSMNRSTMKNYSQPNSNAPIFNGNVYGNVTHITNVAPVDCKCSLKVFHTEAH